MKTDYQRIKTRATERLISFSEMKNNPGGFYPIIFTLMKEGIERTYNKLYAFDRFDDDHLDLLESLENAVYFIINNKLHKG